MDINLNAKTSESQQKKILADLLAGCRVTQLYALNRYNCMRLASRISDLRKLGYGIKTRTKVLPSGKRVAEYYMEGKTILDNHAQAAYMAAQDNQQILQ